MPAYDYECSVCGNIFEVVQKMTEEPITVCPQCGGTVHQIFSAGFGLHFTGKGFYTCDVHKQPAGKTEKEPQHTCSSSCPCGCSK